tara:strand:+ start:425 stop:1927 length:1503 start_codon:yes stop_codon:yes gene_type:complete
METSTAKPAPVAPNRTLDYLRYTIGGIVIAISAYFMQQALYGRGSSMDEGLGYGMVSILLLLFGLGIVFVLPSAIQRFVSNLKLAVQHPEEPWRWKSDWARDQAENQCHTSAALPSCSGLFLLLISTPPLLGKVPGIFTGDPIGLALGLALPLVGSCLLALAAFLQWRARKYGASTLLLDSNPGVVGGWLNTHLQSKLQLGPSEILMASLKCYYIARTSGGTGGRSGSSKHLIWRLDQEIPAHAVEQLDDQITRIPLSFYIPYDSKATTPGERDYYWELHLQVRVAGPNYKAEFRVPVFKTSDSILEVPQEAIDKFGDAVALEQNYLENARARVEVLPGGGLEVRTPPLRFLPVSIIVTVITAYLMFMTFQFIQKLPVGIVPTFIFLCLSALFLLLSAWMWIGRRRATIEAGKLTVQMEILFLKRGLSIPLDEITGVGHWVSANMNGKETSSVYVNVGKKSTSLATGLKNGEARWLSKVIHVHVGELLGKDLDYLDGDDT